MKRFREILGRRITAWLTKERRPSDIPLCDFRRLSAELRPGDVILVEGRSRISEVIKLISQSAWTHSMLYIGRFYDIKDPGTQARVRTFFEGDPNEQLVVEALLGQGTILSPLNSYRDDHLRICRPDGLAPDDAERVIDHVIRRLGTDYDVRQLLDLARFVFPWGFLPRRWRSSLFSHNAGGPTRTVCSGLIAEAFSQINFPVLPFIDRGDDGSVRFFKRNPKLFAPRDFDYSPYFDIIKYPFLGLADIGVYRRLPWSNADVVYNDDADRFVAPAEDDEPSTPKAGKDRHSRPSKEDVKPCLAH